MSVYAPLGRWLEKQPAKTAAFTTTFTVIERLLDRPFPASARQYPAWWSNDESHSQAGAWLSAGWRVDNVDLVAERVSFRREVAAPPVPTQTARTPTPLPSRESGGTVALVACVKTKQRVPAPAQDLYTSPLFVGARAYAERHADRWFILSAKHGLLDPGAVIPPYEQALATMSDGERRAWAEQVLADLQRVLVPGERVILLAGRNYRDPLMEPLQKNGHQVDVPMRGMPYGDQVRWLGEQNRSGDVERPAGARHESDIEHFYDLLGELERRLGGKRLLGNTNGGMAWPERGVEFFFEPGEGRGGDPQVLRVVRIGTHAIQKGSRATLWSRLSQHRGTNAGIGNHRGSVFRLHIGTALLARSGGEAALPTWGQGSKATKEVQEREREHEREVSRYLGSMPLLWLPVEDEAGPESDRALIQRNAIGLLSGAGRRADSPSGAWLGRFSAKGEIRESGLWNVRHVGERYDPGFLEVVERHVRDAGRYS